MMKIDSRAENNLDKSLLRLPAMYEKLLKEVKTKLGMIKEEKVEEKPAVKDKKSPK